MSLCFNTLQTIETTSKPQDFSEKHVILTNPNRITNGAKTRNFRCEFFCMHTERRKLAFVSDGCVQKGVSAQQDADFALLNDDPRRKGCASEGSKSQTTESH